MAAKRDLHKIVDVHVHIAPWHQLKPEIVATMRRLQPDFERVQPYLREPGKFLQLLDREGVEKACLINYVAPDVMGFDASVNSWVHAYASNAPDRLIPFGSLNPFHVKNPKQDVEQLLFTYELGGIKLHPPHQLFAPNDYEIGNGVLKVLYSTCEEARVPVMIHTGTSVFPGARNRFADPLPVDDVAIDYPDLKIVLAHGGRPLWMNTAQFLVRRHPNVYMDVSGIPPQSLLEYFPQLERLSEKVLYGSDWPGPQVPGMRANATSIERLSLSRAAKRRILYSNASKLFG